MEAQEIEKKYRFKNDEEYKKALNASPESFSKSRSLGGNRKSKYVPIEETEAIADFVFDNWNVIQEEVLTIVNEVVVIVKIQYQPSYPGADIYFCTGSASKAIQQQKDSKAEDFPKHKILNSLEYNLPAARSAAINCALGTLGNLFGRNLNRSVKSNHKKG